MSSWKSKGGEGGEESALFCSRPSAACISTTPEIRGWKPEVLENRSDWGVSNVQVALKSSATDPQRRVGARPMKYEGACTGVQANSRHGVAGPYSTPPRPALLVFPEL